MGIKDFVNQKYKKISQYATLDEIGKSKTPLFFIHYFL